MKKVTILIILAFGILMVNAQEIKVSAKEFADMCKRDTILQVQNKSLTDSIVKLCNSHKNERKNLNDSIKVIRKDLVAVRNLNTQLESSKIKSQRDSLQLRVEKLEQENNTLKQDNSEKDNTITNIKKRSDENAKLQFTKGKQEILTQIELCYAGPFDNLISSSSLSTLAQDLSIVTNEAIKKKIRDMQTYFHEEQVLSVKYDEQKVNSAKSKLLGLEQTEMVKSLSKKLDDYSDCTQGLISVIIAIQELDNKFTANDEDSQKKKKGMIMSEFSSYVFNYRFNFKDYPYLSKIVLTIIDVKQMDANTDISEYLKQL